MADGHVIAVRRQWAPWRTPWIWRKLRARSAPHRGYGEGKVALFRSQGSTEGVGSFVAGAFDQFAGGSFLDAVESDHPGAYVAGQVTQAGFTEMATALFSGGSGGGDFLGDLDEAAVVILGAIAVALILIVAIPLGILAVEVVLGLLVVLLGLCLRVAHVRPWTILVSQDGQATAAFSVTGWRASCRTVSGLREQAALRTAEPGAGNGRFRPADEPIAATLQQPAGAERPKVPATSGRTGSRRSRVRK